MIQWIWARRSLAPNVARNLHNLSCIFLSSESLMEIIFCEIIVLEADFRCRSLTLSVDWFCSFTEMNFSRNFSRYSFQKNRASRAHNISDLNFPQYCAVIFFGLTIRWKKKRFWNMLPRSSSVSRHSPYKFPSS